MAPVTVGLPGSSVHGISQARILEEVAISFSRESSRPKDETHVSCTAAEFFTTEPPGKPQKAASSSLFQPLKKHNMKSESLYFLLHSSSKEQSGTVDTTSRASFQVLDLNSIIFPLYIEIMFICHQLLFRCYDN